jgi:tetratricopeptide (TPR) repeat protein
MGFRERPEYQDWRDAVFRLFGEKCIRCGHTGNIHARHVMPVNEYPELVFEPTNGVPLCGNCHTEIKGNEFAHVDDLKRLQLAILGGEAAVVSSDEPSESLLRERAYAEPSNAEAVQAWFEVADAKAAADFYDKYQEDSTHTAGLCERIALRLETTGRWRDVIAVADKAMEITQREGTLEASVEWIGCAKSDALHKLGQLPEAVAFVRALVGRFPQVVLLHHNLSKRLLDVFQRARDKNMRETATGRRVREPLPVAALDAIEESVRHALEAAELAPDVFWQVSWASLVLRIKGDYASALRHGKRALALASTDEDRTEALQGIAEVYERSDLYADARTYLREALEIDDCNVDLIGDIAHCYFMEGNKREAFRMAKHGLLLDPHNKVCQDILR